MATKELIDWFQERFEAGSDEEWAFDDPEHIRELLNRISDDALDKSKLTEAQKEQRRTNVNNIIGRDDVIEEFDVDKWVKRDNVAYYEKKSKEIERAKNRNELDAIDEELDKNYKTAIEKLTGDFLEKYDEVIEVKANELQGYIDEFLKPKGYKTPEDEEEYVKEIERLERGKRELVGFTPEEKQYLRDEIDKRLNIERKALEFEKMYPKKKRDLTDEEEEHINKMMDDLRKGIVL